MALIKCDNVTLAYEHIPVVENLSFELNSGDYLCIVGENGSGKSTLVKALLGLKEVNQGEILFADGLTSNEVGYLPQQTVTQKDFPASVQEVVLSGCLSSKTLKPFYSKEDKATADANMERLGIKYLKKQCYADLSGGQQQRALLARALCATKNLIILDEPVSGLDPMVTDEMYHLIHRLNHFDGITVIMVTHDIKCSIEHATHILHMQKDRVFFGTKEEYVISDLGQYFLGGDHCCD